MKYYAIDLEGSNFLVDLDGSVQKVSFQTKRYVEAPTRDEAEVAAVDSLRGDDTLRAAVLNLASDPPMIDVVGAGEMESFDDLTTRTPALAWEPEKNED